MQMFFKAWVLILLVIAVVGGSARVPGQERNIAEDIKKQQQLLEADLSKLSIPFDILQDKYLGALTKLKTDLQLAGKLKEMLSVDAELQSLASGSDGPLSNYPVLKRLQEVYRSQRATIHANGAKMRREIIQSFQKNATDLVVKLTKEGRIEEAKLALAEADRLEAMSRNPTIPKERKTIQRIEGESLKVESVTRGVTKTQETSDFHAGVWSGNAQFIWYGGELGDTLRVLFPVVAAGKQRVKAVLSGFVDFGVAAVALDGRPVPGSPFDQQAESGQVSDILDWGVHDLSVGNHQIEIKMVGSNGRKWAKSPPFVFGLDYLQLEPPTVIAVSAPPGTDVALTARPSASSCDKSDHVKHLNSPETPGQKSNDRSVPHHSWYPRRGGMEWAQYEWETPQVIGESRVFWFDDSSVRGGCKLPAFWRLLYREESGAWVPVEATMPDAVVDGWNRVVFPAVKTTALRLSVQCQPGWSAGVCHWKAIAADPAMVSDPKLRARADLFLGDLSPRHAQVGWEIYRVNHISDAYQREGSYLTLAGKPCTEHLWAHANSRLVFAVPQGYTRFTAVGIGFRNDRPDMGHIGSGTWTYSIEVDGKNLFTSQELKTYPNKELQMDVSFPVGSKYLTLVIDNCRNGHSDHSHWAYPRLRAGGGAPLMPVATTVLPTPSPTPPIPSPSASARTNFQGMILDPAWLPDRMGMAQRHTGELRYYAQRVIADSAPGVETAPDFIWGNLKWLMPIDEAIKSFGSVTKKPIVKLASDSYPRDSLTMHGLQGRFKDGKYRYQFSEVNLIADAKGQLVSVQFVSHAPKVHEWIIGPPVEVKGPCYDFVHIKTNASTGNMVSFQLVPYRPGVKMIKLVLHKQPQVGGWLEDSHWYLPAPLAARFIEIADKLAK